MQILLSSWKSIWKTSQSWIFLFVFQKNWYIHPLFRFSVTYTLLSRFFLKHTPFIKIFCTWQASQTDRQTNRETLYQKLFLIHSPHSFIFILMKKSDTCPTPQIYSRQGFRNIRIRSRINYHLPFYGTYVHIKHLLGDVKSNCWSASSLSRLPTSYCLLWSGPKM